MGYNQKYLLPIILDGVSILHWQDTHGNIELITVYSTLSNIAQSKLWMELYPYLSSSSSLLSYYTGNSIDTGFGS